MKLGFKALCLGTCLASLGLNAHADTTQCVSGSYVGGMDVSNYDYDTQFGLAKSSGHRFSFMKATEGLHEVDPSFERNWKDSKIAGVYRSAYHFFHPYEDPEAQAIHFVQTIGKLETGDLPPMMDLEVRDGQSNATIIKRAKAFLNEVEYLTGMVPILYMDVGFWRDLGEPSGFNRYPLFIADWYVSCPTVPSPFRKWTFWQKTDIGTVYGVGTHSVDLDLFNGSLSALKALGHP